MEYTTVVIEVLPRSKNAVSIRFAKPAGFTYLPGQYMFITLRKGGETLMKHLTISSSPTEPFLEVTKGLTSHPFANALSALVPGDGAVINGPFGEFTFSGEYDQVVFISGGIGITPLRSMIRNATDLRLSTRILLLYSARSQADVLFGIEMEQMMEQNPNLNVILTLTVPDPGWKGRSGRIDSTLIEREIPALKEQVFFTSGPSVMVDAMVAILEKLGVQKDHIHQELFPGY
jgi:ferredoxin-NADP reductase